MSNFKGNIPNTLTLARLASIPLLLVLYPMSGPAMRSFCGLIFFVAAVLDILDGYLARRLHATSKLGALLDPIADKMIDATGLILLVSDGIIFAWIAVVIICRDIAVSGMRLIALEKGFTVNVNMAGKIKTWFTEAAIVGLMINRTIDGFPFRDIGLICIWGALIFTVYSGYVYWQAFWKKYKRA